MICQSPVFNSLECLDNLSANPFSTPEMCAAPISSFRARQKLDN
jgi:hypothetical protein